MSRREFYNCPTGQLTEQSIESIRSMENPDTLPYEGEWTGTWTPVLIANLKRDAREGMHLQDITDHLWALFDGPARAESVQKKLNEFGFWVDGMEEEEDVEVEHSSENSASVETGKDKTVSENK